MAQVTRGIHDDWPQSLRRWLLVFLAALFVMRVVALIYAPHTDPSESRYAEIARKMVETREWVIPQFDYGVPFWAKPPLSMWMSALGIELFGANEFGSRILIFLTSLALLFALARFGKEERNRDTGLAAAILLFSMPLFYFCSAAVMTDLPFTASTTMAMICFRMAMKKTSRLWGYGFFLALGAGLLAKGPLVLVLAGMPIGLWVLLRNQWLQTWKSLPWISGTLLMLAVSAPWYAMAEQRTPGFIDYFLIGEHWKRFTVKGWKGDLYGNAHAEPIGFIWLFWLAGIAPWFFGWIGTRINVWRPALSWLTANDGWYLYLLLWILAPLVFFTTARNIIATYPLPALPATALLLACMTDDRLRLHHAKPGFHPLHPTLICLSSILCLGAGTVFVGAIDFVPKDSERSLVRRYLHDRNSGDHLVYLGRRKYSAEFYLKGQVSYVKTPEEITQLQESPGKLYLAAKSDSFEKLPESLRKHFIEVGRWSRQTLYVERTDLIPLVGIDPSQTPPIGE